MVPRVSSAETVFEPNIKITEKNIRTALPSGTACGILDPQVWLNMMFRMS